MRTFLDTSVFLYAAGKSHPCREACARVLESVADGGLDAVVSAAVLQELLIVVAGGTGREQGVRLTRSVAALFPDLLPVTAEDMREASAMILRHPRVPIRGAIHAATMLRHGVRRVISLDESLDRIPEIQRVDPREA
ncbi:MAG TPA: type II toxin-antitoxin system VapC family toxin [Candidatus Polarisedimenticolaceae bacterium]|nr:type II toxin-antitoxin system VapC family toxin [Candidatus Polarisedimenticolaceae bacterium]